MDIPLSFLKALLSDSALVKEWKEKEELTLDSSFYSSIDACETKALFGAVGKYQLAGGALALVFGSAFHVALEAYYNGESKEYCIEAALLEWDKNQEGVVPDVRRSRTTLEILVSSYIEHDLISGDRFTPIHMPNSDGPDHPPLIANELAFKSHLGTTLDGYKLNWKGKIDLIVKEGSSYWLVDHKTTTVMGEQYLADKHRSNQMVGYTYAARHNLGIPVKGVILNVAAVRTKGFEFARFRLPISDFAVYEWAREVDHTLTKLHEELKRLHVSVASEEKMTFVAVNREACCTKFGECVFMRVCQALPSHRQELLMKSGVYNVSTFDPLKA